MQVTTNRFGVEETVEVAEDQIYEFALGLAGFEDHHRFALISETDSPIEWLQSLDDPRVSFSLLEPFLFYPGYGCELSDADAQALDLRGPEEALVRCVLTVREAADETTANLLAPIVLNQRARVGRQVLLQETNMPLRYPVVEVLQLPASA